MVSRLARLAKASRQHTGPITAALGLARIKYVLAACALLVGPAIANAGSEPPERMSLGSARATLDVQQCLDQKLRDLGMPVVAGSAPLTTMDYGQGEDRLDVEITDGGDLRLVTVKAFRKLPSHR